MDPLLRNIAQRAEAELEDLRKRARVQGWDTQRCEREKAGVALRHDVTLCGSPGCLSIASAVPGFEELEPRCADCAGS